MRDETTKNGSLNAVDFDLHGFVGIRLIGATSADVASVTRQVGPMQGALDREPDIAVRFVDHIPVSSPLRLLDLDDAAFDDDHFFVLRRGQSGLAKARIPFEDIGSGCEIICESGISDVPLLIPILNLTALAKGLVPVHAAAFTYRGTGVLVAGWAKGGKTETLLAFMAKGAEYIGDEWIYVPADGRLTYGIPEPIKIWDWHLTDLPQYRSILERGDRARLRTISLGYQAARGMGGGRVMPARSTARAMSVLRRQMFVHVTPERLFGRGSCALSGGLDQVVFVASHDAIDIRVEPIEPQEVATRMVFSLDHERLSFMSYYLGFRFAFPEAVNKLIDQAHERQRRILSQALAGKPAVIVYHPFPAPIPALFDAIAPRLEGIGKHA